MSELHAETVPFVRDTMLPQAAPPARQSGAVLWLRDLGPDELARLREHLRRFEAEVTGAVERTLHGSGGLRA